MTFSKEMVNVEKELTTRGHIVILPKFTRDYAKLETIDHMHTESARNKIEHDLIRGYFNEIKKADAVLIINERRNNIDGYIGGNSFLEMGFAHVLNKKIFLLNQIPQISYSDELKAMQPIILNGEISKIN